MKTHLIDLQILIDSKNYAASEQKIAILANKLLGYLSLEGYELSLLIVDDPKIQELNKSYRGKDKATDVLSFPQNEWENPLTLENKENQVTEGQGANLLGDIIISLDHAHKNASLLGHSVSREFCFLLVHGLLHLCGHDHMLPHEEKLMISQQKKLIKFLEKDAEGDKKPLWVDCILTKKDL